FDVFEGEENLADCGDARGEGEMFLRLPGEAVLEVFQDGFEGGSQVAFEFVADGDGMDHHMSWRILFGAFFGGGAGNHGGAFQERVEAVVGAGDDAFGEDDQGALGMFEGFDGGVEGGAVHPFAVDGKCAGAAEHEGLKFALHEEVRGGHDEDNEGGERGQAAQGG